MILYSSRAVFRRCFERAFQLEEVTLEVEKVCEVCNEVTPDILLGLCCIGL